MFTYIESLFSLITHGFIVGALDDISYETQGMIDSNLEIEQKDGGVNH